MRPAIPLHSPAFVYHTANSHSSPDAFRARLLQYAERVKRESQNVRPMPKRKS